MRRDRDLIQRTPRELVDRPRLRTLLDGALDHPVTLIDGPAGSGKSTLVASWLGHHLSLGVRWIVATDPRAVMRTFAAVLDGDHPDEVGDRADTPTVEDLLWAPDERAPDVIVLDGVDTVELAAAASDLARLVAEANGPVRLIIVGRCAMSPALLPMRLAGSLCSIDATDLTLDHAELSAVVHAYASRPISIAEPADLAELLDGWMAAAAIAGVSHPGGTLSPSELATAASGAMVAYVTTEVLRDVDDQLRQFLLRTACLPELDPALCDAIIGRTSGDQALGCLRSIGFPIVVQPGGAVRLLHPVRAALDAMAQLDDAAGRTRSLRAAAAWLDTHDRPFEAADCLARLDDWTGVVTVVMNHLPRILERDEIGRLAELVAIAPTDVIREHAALALSAAWVLRMEGRVTAATELLAIYSPYMNERALMIADVSRASVSSWSDNAEAALAYAERAIHSARRLRADSFDGSSAPFPTSFGDASPGLYEALAHGAGLLAGTYAGKWEQSVTHLVDIDADTLARMPQIRHVELLGIRATHYALGGQPIAADMEAHAAADVARQSNLTTSRVAADGRFAAGEALRLMLRHDEASEPLRLARTLAEHNGRRNLIGTITAAEANIAIDAGKPEAAREMLERFRHAHPHRFPTTVAGMLAAAEARMLSAVGRFQAALRCLEQAPLTPPAASARVAALLGLGDIAAAQAVVRGWPEPPTVDSRVRRALAAAVICDHSGDRRRAELARTAFDLAAPQLLLQPFIEFGPGSARLVRHIAADDSPAARALQDWLGAESASFTAAKFTARESMVMSHVAEGRKLREIADTVHISINTVRTHLHSAYRKLAVDNRADAVRAWRDIAAHQPGDDAGTRDR